MGASGETWAVIAAKGKGDHGGRSGVSPIHRFAPGIEAVLRSPVGPSENHLLPVLTLLGRISKPDFPPTTSTFNN